MTGITVGTRAMAACAVAIAVLSWRVDTAAQPAPAARDLVAGRWIGGENGEEDLELLVEIGADLRGTITRLGQSTPRPPAAIVLTDAGTAHFRATVAGDDEALHFLVQTANQMLGWEERDNDFGVLRRLVDGAPAVLLGEWEAIDPRGGGLEWRANIEAERISLDRDSVHVESPLWVIVSDDTTQQLAFPHRAGGEPLLYHFQQLPTDGFLAWQEGDDDLLVVTRPGLRPSWIGSGPSAGGAPPPPPLGPPGK